MQIQRISRGSPSNEPLPPAACFLLASLHMQHPRPFLLALTLLVVGCAGEVTSANDALLAAPGVLDQQNDTFFWDGGAGPEYLLTGVLPEACLVSACDAYQISVNLDDRAWQHPRNTGVQIAVRWENEEDDLELYVYRDGEQVAASEGIVSTAEAVLIPRAPNGIYTVYVAYAGGDFPIHYEGMAQVERGVAEPSTPRELLPDLTMLTNRRARFALGGFLTETGPGDSVGSCYPDETAEDGASRCLRFDQIISNDGEGALELRLGLPHDPAAEPRAFQRTYWSDGSSEDRDAGTFELHPTHGHFHYESFARSALYPSNAAGERLSDDAQATGHKVSFCIVDVEMSHWGERGDGPRTYVPPGCLHPTESDDDYEYMVQGITRGWADVYDWYLQGQYIEVSALSDGYYILENVADPDDLVREADEDNNCGSTHIRLYDMETDRPQVEILGPGPACRTGVGS